METRPGAPIDRRSASATYRQQRRPSTLAISPFYFLFLLSIQREDRVTVGNSCLGGV